MKRNSIKGLRSFILLLFISVSAYAQEVRKVAVFAPLGEVDKVLLEIVREEISSVVVNKEGYTVLERQLINTVLEENRFQESGLVDDEQVSEIGKLMGADYVFVTTISALGANYYISCKMIEVATARIDKQFTGTSTDGINDIPQTTQYIVRRLFGENVRQQVYRQPQQTDRPAQPAAVQRDAPAVNRQSETSDYNRLASYSVRLSVEGMRIYSSGKQLRREEVTFIMENTDALVYYNKGFKQRKTGNVLIIIGCSSLCVGAITDFSLGFIGLETVIGASGFCVTAIPGFIIKSKGKKNINKAVTIYNDGGYVYSEPPPSIEIDFGITSSGGIGFAVKF